jgi:CheY-like chemotaxis protein
MELTDRELSCTYQLDFKLFLELMASKVREVMLVSSPYDAFILEEDVTLASRLINEYSGLNLSQPPRITRTSSGLQALQMLEEKPFDLVITMPRLEDMDAFVLGKKIKEKNRSLPVYLLAYSLRGIQSAVEDPVHEGIDKVFIWSGNADLLLAIIKCTEDRLNVDHDTSRAQVRVLIFVEDSPLYYSSLLPIFYKEVVRQIQAVMELGVNEEERLLIMRTRPKILLARNFEEASELYEKYKPYLLGIISDTRFPKQGRISAGAGIDLLSRARREMPYLPLLLFSSEPGNKIKADGIPAIFLDKNSPNLLNEIHDYFLGHLGFGEFVFHLPDGTEVGRADKLRMLEEKLAEIPDESLCFHIERKHLAAWVMMRSEIALGSTLNDLSCSSFSSTGEMRRSIISLIRLVRKWRQKGVITQFNPKEFDADLLEFSKIGHGSLGGKARGLAFMSSMLKDDPCLRDDYPKVSLKIPRTIVIGTDVFEEFVEKNGLRNFASEGFADQEIDEAFLKGQMPKGIVEDLRIFLSQMACPLSVRSSSLMEDAQFLPHARLYRTCMIANNDIDPEKRLERLLNAIRLVYASTFHEGPKTFSRNMAGQTRDDAMAVMIQELVGEVYGDHFYPAMSGRALSHNFYPIGPMKPEEGIVQMAIGFGTVMEEGKQYLRFSPKYPEILPQFSTVDDMLANSQRFFSSLHIGIHDDGKEQPPGFSGLEKCDIYDARNEYPVRAFSSTYDPAEHLIRDTGEGPGGKIITFFPILKHRSIPLPEIISKMLEMARKNMGCPVELEFAVTMKQDDPEAFEMYILKMRPMTAEGENFETGITSGEREKAFCFSSLALGNGIRQDISDIIFVKPEAFRREATVAIAEEVGRLNTLLVQDKSPYLLIGPGRWGSLDRWLGIPVKWKQISGVGVILEQRNNLLKADASLGSHFFQHITSQVVSYITVTDGTQDFLDENWLQSLPVMNETGFLKHVKLGRPMTVKIDGIKSQCVMYIPAETDILTP